MSNEVIWEMQFMAVVVTAGIFMAAAYDVLRIFRRIIKHGVWWIAAEDILFWAAAAIAVFIVSFWENDGQLRWYTFAGVALGALLYHETLSSSVVKYVSKAILLPINIITKPLKKLAQSYRINRERSGDDTDGKT